MRRTVYIPNRIIPDKGQLSNFDVLRFSALAILYSAENRGMRRSDIYTFSRDYNVASIYGSPHYFDPASTIERNAAGARTSLVSHLARLRLLRALPRREAAFCGGLCVANTPGMCLARSQALTRVRVAHSVHWLRAGPWGLARRSELCEQVICLGNRTLTSEFRARYAVL